MIRAGNTGWLRSSLSKASKISSLSLKWGIRSAGMISWPFFEHVCSKLIENAVYKLRLIMSRASMVKSAMDSVELDRVNIHVSKGTYNRIYTKKVNCGVKLR